MHQISLLDGSRGIYTVSDIGIKATFGTKEEMEEALDKAVRRIDLWRLIYDKCGKSPEENTFWIDLADITGITRPDSQIKAALVRKAYIEDAKYILTVKAHATRPESKAEESGEESEKVRDRKQDMEVTTKDAVVFIRFPGIGTIDLDINEANLSLAEQIIKSIRATIQKEKSPSDEPPTE